MSAWEYRVCKHPDGTYGLYEFGEDGDRTTVPVQDTIFPSLAELRADIQAMLDACDKPVVEE